MDKIFLCNNEHDIRRVYDAEITERLGIPSEIFGGADLETNRDRLRDVKYVFSTWGMPRLTKEQIAEYLPSLEAVFYAAGSVVYFAKPFLESGVRVFSAAYPNDIPVAEYTVSQILLASKGYFLSQHFYKSDFRRSSDIAWSRRGNYRATVGLIGLGIIGSMVADRLQEYDIDVYAYDPFATEEKAAALKVKLTDLRDIFANCDVVSNHLANKPVLNDILNYSLFSLMKDDGVFINTGRGAQVNEEDLARALDEKPMLTALIDVIKDEDHPETCPFFRCENAFITPHIAGSMGNEVLRLSRYVADIYDIYVSGGIPGGDITLDMLDITA